MEFHTPHRRSHTPRLVYGGLSKPFPHPDIPTIAAQFHGGLMDVMCEVIGKFRQQHGITKVALSGGCPRNKVLLEGMVSRAFQILCQHKSPWNSEPYTNSNSLLPGKPSCLGVK